ncbi:Protein kinase-like (PK-like) [Glarea lozoyensis ATCC 20868]|uniref:Protein kinase-like (PK-like) n=1 Tax=Glarea lozoyensis (strain ATCC 20868 / MF5171) TaxID=1116229 RepID=S3CQP2_GLAL2|nr:Protein kinase-like (PK-like) [Glarea lozoyensis ATCC 20868]EPE28005.1 Protein kinase-like (PK-like) [Glarea lozoyensis ATCC 20868]
MHYQGFLAAMSPGYPYRRDTAISDFFSRTLTCSSACDEMAISIVGGTVQPVAVQGNCSYSIYAGPDLEYVFQFRLASLPLETETIQLARTIHGSVVPAVSSYGQLANVHVYSMPRVHGLSYLDLILADIYPRNSKEQFAWRKTLVTDIACFFAASFKAPQEVPSDFRGKLRQQYTQDLESLLQSFPPRFHNIIQKCLDSMEAVLDLPVVLLHRDISTANLIVDADTCELKGVLDWGEAGLGTFGQNLHFLQNLICVLDLPHGWRPYEDYPILQETFWNKFQDEVENISPEIIKTMKLASVMGLLLYRGFTRRLAGMASSTPISDDKEGSYNFLYLDAFLLQQSTRIMNLD